MGVLGEILFYRRDQVDLDDMLRYQVDQLRAKVDGLPEKLFSEKSDEELAQIIAQQEAVEPLAVDFAAGRPSVREKQVEVHDQFGFERGPVRISGLEVTKSFPFKGDPEIWRLRTNPWGTNPPRGEVRGDMLVIGISVPAQQTEEAARYIEETITQIAEYLQRQEAQISQHNASLASRSTQWIMTRRQRLTAASDLLKKLGR